MGPTTSLGQGSYRNGGGSKAAAAPKNATLELADGEVAVASSFGISIGQGPAQDPNQNAGQASSLAFYRAKYASLGGVQLPFNIVGTDPAKGAATTTVPIVIVPINVVFAAGTANVKSSGPVELGGSSVEAAVQNSPIFQVADYKRSADAQRVECLFFKSAAPQGWRLAGGVMPFIRAYTTNWP